MSHTFYRKYRPQTFAEVVGQKHIVATLTNALKLGRVGQAYLFTGPRGTGKTTLARLFAKAVNCSQRKGAEPCNKCEHCLLVSEGRSLDVIEIDAASHTGVDNIRELRETVKLPPTLGSHKIYIIDEVHMLSSGAWGALLKTLEEPPAHVIFVLATTALHKVPETIVSRCQRFDFSRLSAKLISEKLKSIAKQEKIKIEDGALDIIAQTAEGGMRDAESLLSQITSLEESAITEDKVIEILGATTKENVAALLRLIAGRKLYESLSFARELIRDGADPAIFCGVFLHYLRDLLLVAADPQNGLKELDNLTDEQKSGLLEFSAVFTPADVVRMLEYAQIAQAESKTAVISELPLEIAIVKIISNKTPKISETENKTLLTETKTDEQKQAIQASAENKTVTKTKASKKTASEKTSPTQSSVDIETVREKWLAILEKAKELNASLSLALRTARPLEIRGSTIEIAVKYAFHKERLEEPSNQLTLEEAFASILGSKIRISVTLENTLAENLPRQNQSQEKFLENPLISQALDLLGGQVITTENN